MTESASSRVYFGGPDLAPGRLRDLLSERIAQVPTGGAIDWVTYYLRDRGLARELLEAKRRGVRVSVTLERQPRTAGANDAVIELLSGEDGLGAGLRTVLHPRMPTLFGIVWKPHLHTKLFCFSHPRPSALVGSFNPVCDEPELAPETLRIIGDHDRGHNLLVELTDCTLVQGLVRHARHLHGMPHTRFEHRDVQLNETVSAIDADAYFWPRVEPNPIHKLLHGFGADVRLRVAASHLKGPGIITPLLGLARRGAQVELLTATSVRRVSARAERLLRRAGVSVCRMPEADNLPMHLKFLLVERGRRRWSVFGSYNWTFRARWLNHEIAVISRDSALFDAFLQRWDQLWSSPHGQST